MEASPGGTFDEYNIVVLRTTRLGANRELCVVLYRRKQGDRSLYEERQMPNCTRLLSAVIRSPAEHMEGTKECKQRETLARGPTRQDRQRRSCVCACIETSGPRVFL